MKVSAIICEYNPLHNGHLHHIEETRKNGATHLIGVLSSNFVQRGDVAMISKFDRAHLAVNAGIDLVIELPSPFSCAAAEVYATGAISLLNALGIVDELSFGSSLGDMESIFLLKEASLSTTEIYGKQIREHMKKGESYPSAVWAVVQQRYGEHVSEMMHDPNNLLAIEYLKAMQKLNVSFEPFTILRRCVMHDSFETKESFASASFIRKCISEGDFSCLDYVPSYTKKVISERIQQGKIANIRHLEKLILYKMRTISEEEILSLPDMNEPLMNRFFSARTENSLDAFFARVKSKCYTMSRIRRIVMCALAGIEKKMILKSPPYARVLAFNERGRELMNITRKTSKIPVHTSLAKLRNEGADEKKFVCLEEKVSHIYGLAQETFSSAEEDFRARIVMETKKWNYQE